MDKLTQKNLVSTLQKALHDRAFLRRAGLSRRRMQEVWRAHDWRGMFARLAFDGGRINAAQALELCRPAMEALCPAPDCGWLDFCYRCAVDILFPHQGFAAQRRAHGAGALVFLAFFQAALDYERLQTPFDWRWDIALLSPEETQGSEAAAEYQRLSQCWRSDYVYEAMRLGRQATPFGTLAHIGGVHHLAVAAARGLAATGVAVDLALVSGAAMTHDIGKFGCQPGERVPYLHYHYTDQWCKARGIPGIGLIAANHSTWDLELELLQAEALVLIYSDFRVREERDASGAVAKMLSLKDSFDAILSILDDVDDQKLRRYRFVYQRLLGFEEYMRGLGVDVDSTGAAAPRPDTDPVLMSPHQVLDALRDMSIGHNIRLMRRLGSQRLFGNVLEAARSEKKWKNIRAYINIFEEYSIYLSPAQKMQTLSFLYELLMHREGDIRRAAAALAGRIIARFHAGYRKELPADVAPYQGETTALDAWRWYLEMVVRPDHKLSDQHKRWIGFTLKIIVASLLQHLGPDERPAFMALLTPYFSSPQSYDETTAFVLMDALNSIPLDYWSEAQLEGLCTFALQAAGLGLPELEVAAMRVMRRLAELAAPGGRLWGMISRFARGIMPQGATLVFLKGRILRGLGLSDAAQQARLEEGDVVSDIFLDNLKSATPWVVKAINIKLLLDQAERGKAGSLLHIAAHFSNLVKVSERVTVRHDAGAALLRIVPLLPLDQRNEIAVELAKGLEVGEYEFSKYIPDYLGPLALWLHPKELDELISSSAQLLNSGNERIVSVALRTLGLILENYGDYPARFAEAEEAYRARQDALLGYMMRGLASHLPAMRQETMLVLGQCIFGSAVLPAGEKARIFSVIYRKLLFLLAQGQEDQLTFFYMAAALNHIYRFISAWQLDGGSFEFRQADKVAFFPGTFDPFTLSHKGIAREIRRLGFEVMLAVDEFSWSKKTQPRGIRRKIAGMSVAGEFGVHIFPDSIPVNMANPGDLRRLEQCFPGRRVYMVVGTDVVQGASSYQAAPAPGSIHHMNHIIFLRAGEADGQPAAAEARGQISGDVIQLALPVHLEDISSTRIRENIDSNRDISHLIDPMAQDYIYSVGLYLREPQYKPVMSARDVDFTLLRQPGRDALAAALGPLLGADGSGPAIDALLAMGSDVIILRNSGPQDAPSGLVAFRYISSSELYSELQSAPLAEVVRRKASGRMLLISGLLVGPGCVHDGAQLLLTEALADALGSDCTYAMCHPCHPALYCGAAADVLDRQGFEQAATGTGGAPLWLVDMATPQVLIQNLELTIKEPLAGTAPVVEAVRQAHARLQRALTRLYPGNLVLSFSSGVIHNRILRRVTQLGGVPAAPTVPRQLGPYMCVPYGKLLRGRVVPNTVTKTIHTDKVYQPDLTASRIDAYPDYPDLASQVRTIKSFMRPAVLVDDLMHAGDRILALEPLLRQEGVEVRTVLVGLLSGRGRDLMEARGLPVDGIYYIPSIKRWFVESTLYPFIGGDTVQRGQGVGVPGLLPAVNMILPYASPDFSSYCPRQAVYDFSMTCLQNSLEILRALEGEYRGAFERNLTLSRLSEAIILPLCPDKGGCMSYDPNLLASVFVENDMEMLGRMREIIISGK